MAEYTPTTSEVLAAYVIGEHLTNSTFPVAETEACFRNWLREHDEKVRREAAAEQREGDAQIAEQHGAPEPSRRFSPEHWDEWRERTSITIAAAIREQGNDA